MEEISEETFNEIMDKLMLTIITYEGNFKELWFLKNEIESIKIKNLSRLDYLSKINEWTYEVASRSYVIRFIHHRLQDDIDDAKRGEYKKNQYLAYLEFAYK